MVTHDQEEALSMADRVVVMNQGVIEQIGTPQQIYREPASAFVADFVGKINVISAVAEGDGRFRVGTLVLNGAQGDAPVDAGHPGPPLPAAGGCRRRTAPRRGTANAAHAKVTKVEFLGAFCHVTVAHRRRRRSSRC